MLTRLFKSSSSNNESEPLKIVERPGGYVFFGGRTKSGKVVTVESSQSVATAYRAANIISDDIAKMPLQQFERSGESIERIVPNASQPNNAYLVGISPNSFGWTPFIFKKAAIQWLLFYGNAYIWSPPVRPAQKYILPADQTAPVLDDQGRLWYEVRFVDGKTRYLPDVEVLQLLINPDRSGFRGRGVIEYARETLGRQIAAYETESNLLARGFNPSMIMKMGGELDKEGRKKVREAYEEALGGSENAGGVAVFDRRVLEFHPIEMKLVDMQFLESIRATDLDIANFFGMSLHMLNMGKEAYNSNEQKYLEYLSGTLDAYLVQFEQAARVRWLTRAQQTSNYFRFNRNALLRMDAKTRAEYGEIRIRTATMTPNEFRSFEDESPYDGGEAFYITKNYGSIPSTGDQNEPTQQ